MSGRVIGDLFCVRDGYETKRGKKGGGLTEDADAVNKHHTARLTPLTPILRDDDFLCETER